MPLSVKKMCFLGLFLLYSLILIFILNLQLRLDFTSFYSATLAYIHDVNPYKSLTTAGFDAIPTKLPINLNPPVFLQLMIPFTFFNLKIAASFWFILSLFLGSIGALLCFKLTCAQNDYKTYWPAFLFMYCILYSTIMNASIGQIGGFLLFFVMTGYHFYLKKQDYLAGVFWGIIIAIKFFPGLLFLLVLQQRRYKVFAIMLFILLFTSSIPFLIKGAAIYSIYFNMLPHVLWFGDNWNASLYGFLFRIFVHGKELEYLWLAKTIYLCLFMILLFWYVKKLNCLSPKLTETELNIAYVPRLVRGIQVFLSSSKTLDSADKPRNVVPGLQIPTDHRAFCLTLVMMLLLSPMGWLYYFSLLIMPSILIWQSLSFNTKLPVLWGVSLFLINFPMGYIEATDMMSMLSRLSIFSIYFYGLLLMTYLVSNLKEMPSIIELEEQHSLKYLFPLKASLTLGIFVISSTMVIHLLS